MNRRQFFLGGAAAIASTSFVAPLSARQLYSIAPIGISPLHDLSMKNGSLEFSAWIFDKLVRDTIYEITGIDKFIKDHNHTNAHEEGSSNAKGN